jgi:hypothetical protein
MVVFLLAITQLSELTRCSDDLHSLEGVALESQVYRNLRILLVE